MRSLKALAGIGIGLIATTGGMAATLQPVAIDAGALPLVREIDERFMSFQIGFSHLTGGETWKAYDEMPSADTGKRDFAAIREARVPTDLASPRLRTLTKALGPLYIRYSGTTANSVYFHDSDAPPPASAPAGYTVLLTRKAWKGAIDFAHAVDAKVLTSFTNSEGVRDVSHAWTPRMAASWMAYTRAIGGELYAAELFNEPNAPEPPRIPKGHTAEEYARDFAAFRGFMSQAAPRTKLAGPGTAKMGVGGIPSIEWVTSEDYATASPAPKFDIVSYHYYPALAERCAPASSVQGMSADRALSDDWLARPEKEFQAQKALRDRHAPGAKIWLTETGGAACGGLRWQPAFLDVFRFADTHARLARQGLDAMFTHALISGSNGVIDEKTFEPNASYWSALLWRRLMGTRVLDAGPNQAGFHLYAHCQRGVPSGVTLLAINLEAATRTLRIGRGADLYALTAPDLLGRAVQLNGKTLALAVGDALPAIEPKRARGSEVTLAPTSINFIAMPRANNPACRVN
ncbi:hypothetical protein WG901_23460 [Novosphingobium sp. PS1R-30]|uniref:Glycosyl hydrolase family 79 n=1 Tax=Novosphingobium anseongense TaxID=3133436 RepID=A0ABU8S2Q2_9SPHN